MKIHPGLNNKALLPYTHQRCGSGIEHVVERPVCTTQVTVKYNLPDITTEITVNSATRPRGCPADLTLPSPSRIGLTYLRILRLILRYFFHVARKRNDIHKIGHNFSVPLSSFKVLKLRFIIGELIVDIGRV